MKSHPGADWGNFYGFIDGFDYEPGYEYVLKVDSSRVVNPPQDGSAIKDTLLEQVSKSKVEQVSKSEVEQVSKSKV